MTEVVCPVCRAKVFRNKAGKILMHTTSAMGGRRPSKVSGWRAFGDTGAPPYQAAEVCSGSSPGAKP